jgi:periodic tryptophan protein 2
MSGDAPSSIADGATAGRQRPDGVPSPHLEFNLRFLASVLTLHGRYIKEHQNEYASELRALTRGIDGVGRAARKLAERNMYEIEFLCQSATTSQGTGKRTGGLVGYGVELESAGNGYVHDRMTIDENDKELEEADSDAEWIGLD